MKVILSFVLISLSLESFAQRRMPPRPGPGPSHRPAPLPPGGRNQIPGPRPLPGGGGRHDRVPPQGRGTHLQLDQIERSLMSGRWQERQFAVQDLINFPVPRAVAIAVKAHGDSDISVVRAAETSLDELLRVMNMELHSLNLLNAVSPLAGTGRWKQRLSAIKVLGELWTAQAMIPILEMSKNESDIQVLRQVDMSLLKLVNQPDLKPVVRQNSHIFIEIFRTSGLKIRRSVIRIVGFSQVRKMVTLVVEASGDPDISVRANANEALQSIISTPQFPGLNVNIIFDLEHLYNTSRNSNVRLSAVKALGATFHPQARPVLVRALSDFDIQVRNAARKALQHF